MSELQFKGTTTKIDLTIQQQDWLRTVVLPWIETRGILNRNLPISVESPEGSGRIIFINEPYDLVFNTLLHLEYKVEDKTDLNLLGRAYLWYQKEGIKWNGH